MRECEQRPGAPERGEPLRGATMKAEHRRATAPDHFDSRPEDAARMPRAQGLHRRLLGGKPRSKRRREVPLAAAVGDLTLCEHPPDEALTVARDCLADTLDLGGIETRSYNVHGVTFILHEPAAGP